MRRRLVHPLERERRLVHSRWQVRLAMGPLDWRERLQWWRYRATPVLMPLGIGAAVAAALLLLWLALLPAAWTLEQRLRHVAAAPGCGSARHVGLAPARRGEPGYYALHDADSDGVACEPFVSDRNLTLELVATRTWSAVSSRLWPRPPGELADRQPAAAVASTGDEEVTSGAGDLPPIPTPPPGQ